MGTQQMLLVIVGVLMVGLMISVGIIMFTDNASASNRDAIANDLTALASNAQGYYRKPQSLGGGGSSFQGFSLGSSTVTNPNGTYSITAGSATKTRIEGLGIELGYNQSTPVKVAVDVQADSILVVRLN